MGSPDTGYRLAIDVRPAYVLVSATGPRTPENARRFLHDAYEACVRAGRDAVILEAKFTGPSLDRGAIFGVISAGAPEGVRLRRIAYLDPSATDPGGPAFATTVAVNRGVNVRFFVSREAAEAWVSGP